MPDNPIKMTHFFTKKNHYEFKLHKNIIDIWLISLENPAFHLSHLLSDEEMARANAYHFKHHQRRFIQARAMMRYILAQYLQADPSKLEFSTHKHGKPYLTEKSMIEFNLSHSGAFALLAIGSHHRLGIDLEFFSMRPFIAMAQKVFSPQEIEVLGTLPKTLLPYAFFNIWAQKEAFIKAIGLGLSYPTNSFTVKILGIEASKTTGPQKESLMIRPFMPLIACAAAIAHHPSIDEIRYSDFFVAHRPLKDH